jgi:hypothetical protein
MPENATPPQVFFQGDYQIPKTMWVVAIMVSFLILIMGIMEIDHELDFRKKKKLSAESAPTHTEIPVEVTSTPHASSSTLATAGNFRTKFFSTEDTFLEDRSLPPEIANLADAELVGLDCTEVFQNEGEQSLTDPQLLEFITENPSTSVISRCTTQNNETILHYEIHGGGGINNIAYFAQLTTEGQLTAPVAIQNDGVPYFTCDLPYALTSSNVLYFHCVGGDGELAQVSAYKIDFNTKIATLLQKCRSVSGETTTITCEENE